MEGVGEKGTFPKYPIESHTAVAMVNPDTTLLPHANERQRHIIFSLRLQPEQVRQESPSGKPLQVQYALRLSAGHVGLHDYNVIQVQRLRHSA